MIFFLFTFRVHAWACVETPQKEEVSHQHFFKNEFQLANTVWHIRGGLGFAQHLSCPTLQHLEGKEQKELSQALAEWKRSDLHREGKLDPQNHDQLEILTS